MTYLLDTNAISDLMRSEPGAERWLEGLDARDGVVTCVIASGEILFGIARLPIGRRRTELNETGTNFLAAFRCESVPESAAKLYAEIKVARQQAGRTLDENDLWIAATAMALRATLVSRDSDFEQIPGLNVVAPR